MENQEILDNQQQSSGKKLNFNTVDALGNLGTWMRYAAIIGIVSAVVSIIVNIASKQYAQILVSIITGVFPLIMYFIAAALNQFHSNDNPQDFTRYASSIKNYFMAVGIITIIAVALFIIVIIGLMVYRLTL
jgi:hypothetical protein